MNRPWGVTAVSVYLGFIGALVLTQTISSLSGGAMPAPNGQILLLAIGNFVLPLAMLFAAYGLWFRKKLSPVVGIWATAISVFSALFQLAFIPLVWVVPTLSREIFRLAALVYLLRWETLSAFGWSSDEAKRLRYIALVVSCFVALALTLLSHLGYEAQP
jgi:hypothetical protein